MIYTESVDDYSKNKQNVELVTCSLTESFDTTASTIRPTSILVDKKFSSL